jgi:hypothetical protein
MKKNNTTRSKVVAISLLALSLIVVGVGSSSKSQVVKSLDTTAVELTYRATSPLGGFGGVALPASCESNAWNPNGGYHLDGVTTDPGNCGGQPVPLVPPGSPNGVCGSADGTPVPAAPSSNLCANGTASTVSGSGPWTWSCVGQAGGTTASCSAPSSLINNPPETPVISGDQWAIINQTTSNWIVSTDPEGDAIFYELDWNGSGSVDGTTASQPSGASTPIGHTYNALGTYTVKGRAVQTNDTSKKSGWGIYTIRVTNGVCTAPPNACGVTNGTVVGGQCVSAGLPPGYGTSCSSGPNICGMRDNSGTIDCSGSCGGVTVPSNTLCSCTSAPNSCGMTNTGNWNAAGTVCSATTPPNSACSVPVPPVPPAVVVINDFRASPKLIAVNKTSKLYWDITGNIASCSISYTTNSSANPVQVTSNLGTNIGQLDTTPIAEKRYYKLKCGAVEREAVVSVFSLTEI